MGMLSLRPFLTYFMPFVKPLNCVRKDPAPFLCFMSFFTVIHIVFWGTPPLGDNKGQSLSKNYP